MLQSVLVPDIVQVAVASASTSLELSVPDAVGVPGTTLPLSVLPASITEPVLPPATITGESDRKTTGRERVSVAEAAESSVNDGVKVSVTDGPACKAWLWVGR